MKLAIMQPYFFPYIGYFKLIRLVDKFVFYDDVNFIKSGWINRNRLFLAGAVRYFTVPLVRASSFEKINKTHVKPVNEWSKAMLASISQSYKKAPLYREVINLIENVLLNSNDNIADLARNSITATASYLGLTTDFVPSSAIYGNQDLKNVDRVLDICRIENAQEYWNLPGGRGLYSAEIFSEAGVVLRFIDGSIMPYQQSTTEFHPCLSIIDVLMYNEPSVVLKMLDASFQA